MKVGDVVSKMAIYVKFVQKGGVAYNAGGECWNWDCQ